MARSTFVVAPKFLVDMLLPQQGARLVGVHLNAHNELVFEVEGPTIPNAAQFTPYATTKMVFDATGAAYRRDHIVEMRPAAARNYPAEPRAQRSAPVVPFAARLQSA